MKNTAKLFFARFVILSKRFIKRPVFAILLVLLPILVLMFSVGAEKGSSVAKVALAQENGGDRVSNEIISALLEDRSVIGFEYFNTASGAVEAVLSGSADAAWVFPENTEERLSLFAQSNSSRNYAVAVIERESNVLLNLTREKLCSALYPYLSTALYIYHADSVPEAEGMTEEALLGYYNAVKAEGGDLFRVSYGDAGGENDKKTESLLLYPLRGLLAVTVVVAAVAAALYYKRDEENGVFNAVAADSKALLDIIYHFSAVIPVTLAVLVSVAFSGLFTSVVSEFAAAVLLAASSVAFAILLRILCVNIRVLGAAAPVAVIAILALCPVFVGVTGMKEAKLLLPVYYYLNAVYSSKYMVYMLLYCAALYAAIFVIYAIKRRY